MTQQQQQQQNKTNYDQDKKNDHKMRNISSEKRNDPTKTKL